MGDRFKVFTVLSYVKRRTDGGTKGDRKYTINDQYGRQENLSNKEVIFTESARLW